MEIDECFKNIKDSINILEKNRLEQKKNIKKIRFREFKQYSKYNNDFDEDYLEIKSLLNKIKVLKEEINDLKTEILSLKFDNKKLILELSESKIEIKNQKQIIENAKIKRKNRNKSKKVVGTKEYKQFRESILKRDNYKCQMCGSDFRLQVHHIKSKSQYPELIMDKDNCITLCLTCHSKTDNFFK